MNLTKLVRNPNADSIAVIGAAAVIGIVILTAMHLAVPEYMSVVAITAVGALAGVTLPSAASPAVDLEQLAATIAEKIGATLTAPPAEPPAAAATVAEPTIAPIPGATP